MNNIESAKKVAKSLLERSDLPKSLYPKVEMMVDPQDFVEDGQLDKKRYESTLRNEIIDWETKLYGYSKFERVETEESEENGGTVFLGKLFTEGIPLN